MYNPSKLKSTYDYAVSYLNNGFSVLPLKKKSKTPSIGSWEPFKKSYPSKEELENWFIDSDNNIGLITGRISSIFAIDIDGQEAYEYYIQKIDSLSDKQLVQSIKDTMKIKTGSGNTNFIFQFDPDEFTIDDGDDDIPNNILWKGSSSSDQNNHNEIRLKGEGAYIVVPPSIHPNDKEYKLVNGINPIFLTKNEFKEINLFMWIIFLSQS